jgi:heme-degrading monooxygenase HmoA
MAARVMVFAKIKPGEEAAFEAAYQEVTRKVKGTPGHLRDELLRDTSEPGSYILLSEWESKEVFLAWENAPIHMQTTTPMRPYWAGRVERKIYDVVFRLSPG